MSPIVTTGRGTPDWQRSVSWDGPAIDSYAPGTITTLQTRGPYYLTSWEKLAGWAILQGGNAQWQIGFYQDVALTQFVQARGWVMANALAGPIYLSLPVGGPYAQLNVQPIGVSTQPTIHLFGSNRESISQAPTSFDFLVDLQATPIGGTTTSTFYPSQYFAGPVDLFFQPAAATQTVLVQVMSTAGTWDYIFAASPAASADVEQTLIMPLGAWRVQVQNANAAASTFFLTCMASNTGSS
jgi:hypothetical protein